MKNKSGSTNLLFLALFLLSLVYSLFSYSLTDPNLVISSWTPYWNFQQWMWQTFFHNPQLMSKAYLALVVGFFTIYLLGFKKLKNIKPAQLFGKLLLALSPLFFSYNALSHDVFNYMFNAKMVTLFKVDPHVKVALDFYFDEWTRFMHNTHTPAPYGYGWTIFSVIPYLAGFHKFLPTWIIFKLLSWASYIALFFSLKNISEKISNKKISAQAIWLVFANPLIFIEILSNLHNDLWMLVPAVVSLNLIIKKPKKNLVLKTVLSLFLLFFSISTKLATVVLLPFWIYWFTKLFMENKKPFNWFEKLEKIFPFFISLALFLPLLTPRSQQFLPWYLSWSLIWLPFINNKLWKYWILCLSFTGLIRYIPWMLASGFEGSVIADQKVVVWLGAIALLIITQLFSLRKKKN
jgi:hypothetical protein